MRRPPGPRPVSSARPRTPTWPTCSRHPESRRGGRPPPRGGAVARGEGRAADPQKPDLHHTGHGTGGHSSALPGAVPSCPAAVTVLWDLGVTRTLRSLLLPSTWGGAGCASFPFSRPPESRTVSNGPPWHLPVDGWPNGKGLRATWPPRESGPSAPRMHGTAPGLQVGKPARGMPGKRPVPGRPHYPGV